MTGGCLIHIAHKMSIRLTNFNTVMNDLTVFREVDLYNAESVLSSSWV